MEGTSGDLYVVIHVKDLKGFKREGFDIYIEKEISFPQAVLGAKVPVETLEGEVTILVPEGTEHGQLIRLKGKGITHLGNSGRGDLYVVIALKVPKKISKEGKRLLEQLGKEL
jgi:molecular chaperone DnaJ